MQIPLEIIVVLVAVGIPAMLSLLAWIVRGMIEVTKNNALIKQELDYHHDRIIDLEDWRKSHGFK